MFRYQEGSLRYMTVREAARVQTFPDGYEVCGAWSEGMRQIGNAVPVELARTVAASVACALREDTARKQMKQMNSLFASELDGAVSHETARV